MAERFNNEDGGWYCSACGYYRDDYYDTEEIRWCPECGEDLKDSEKSVDRKYRLYEGVQFCSEDLYPSWLLERKNHFLNQKWRKADISLNASLSFMKEKKFFYKMGVMCGELLYTTSEFDSFEKLLEEAKSINDEFKSDMSNCDFVIQTFRDSSYDFKKSCFSQIRIGVNNIDDKTDFVVRKIINDYSEL